MSVGFAMATLLVETFTRQILRRGPVSGRFWHSFDGRSFNIQLCLTLQTHSLFAVSGERERERKKKKKSAAQQIHNPNQRTPTSQTTFTLEKRTVTTGTDGGSTTGTHTPKNLANPQHLHLRIGTENLKNLAGQTIQTFSFNLNPFPFSLHLFSSHFYFPLLWLPCSTSPFPLLYLPHPPAANC